MTPHLFTSPSSSQPPTDRLAVARGLLAAQQSLAKTLGNHFMANTSLELLLELFIAHETGTALGAGDAIARLGPSPNVTWRWIMALEDDGLVVLGKDGRSGTLDITDRGLDRIRNAIDTVATFG